MTMDMGNEHTESPSVAILIPCKNEEGSIREVVLDCKRELPHATIVVGDNLCTDKTRAIAERLGVTVIPCPTPGKGNALRTMIESVPAEIYLTIDGDGTYSAWDGKRLVLDLIKHPNAAMAIGDRRRTYFSENKSILHAFGNRLVPWLVKTKNHTKETVDVMSGLRAVKSSFFTTFPIQSGGFSVETELTTNLLRHHIPYTTREISYRDRTEGKTKIHVIRDGGKIIAWILRH